MSLELRQKLCRSYHELDAECRELIADSDGTFEPEPLEMIQKEEPDIDAEVRNLTKEMVPRLTKDDIVAMTGLSVPEIDQLQKKADDKKRENLKELTKLAKGKMSDEMRKSYNYLQKSYERTGSLTESMKEALKLFEDYFQEVDIDRMNANILALDVSGFLKIFSGGMKRALIRA
jgi:hypothetical protein